MKRFLIVCLLLVATAGITEASAQNWLDRLGRRAEEAAKRAVERNVERSIERGVDKAFEEGEEAVSNVGRKKQRDRGEEASAEEMEYEAAESTEVAEAAPAAPQAPERPTAEMNWNKFDFVAGDEVLFDDQLAGEQIGEFPSQWDLSEGYAEVAEINGRKVIYATKDTRLMPYMKEKHYLPDVFTIEFDLWVPQGKSDDGYMLGPEIGGNSRYTINLVGEDGDNVFEMWWYHHYWETETTSIGWEWYAAGEHRDGRIEYAFKYNDFNRVSISFNKRALKVYLNETRVANIPRCDLPKSFNIDFYQGEKEYRFLRDIRIAKGAVPLYDRMMSDGKFITYGITFDVGKATIKPESMGEINRIVQLMTENPDLKFSVEGHTDSTGNAASNQTLSEARAQAIVAKLVETGIAADRLTAVGKGQSSPIADNATDEGRAKNRRVEFVKQ